MKQNYSFQYPMKQTGRGNRRERNRKHENEEKKEELF